MWGGPKEPPFGLAVPPENRAKANFYSIAAVVIGLAGAAFCFWLMLQQSASMPSFDTPGF